MNTHTTLPDYTYWNNALNGVFGPVHEGDAQLGFFRKRTRRATLSICGLGMLDETEVSDIADARPAIQPQKPSLVPPSAPKPQDTAPKQDPAMAWVAEQMEVIAQIQNAKELGKWEEKNEKAILKLASVNKEAHEELLSYVMKQYEWLNPMSA